jgi:hypothetical protein
MENKVVKGHYGSTPIEQLLFFSTANIVATSDLAESMPTYFNIKINFISIHYQRLLK